MSINGRAGRMATAAVLLGLAFPVLTACGGGPTTPEDIATEALHRAGDGDAEGLCELMADDGVPAVDEGLAECAQFYSAMMQMASEADLAGMSAGSIDPESAVINDNGDTARIDGDFIHAEGWRSSDNIVLELIDGTWYITDF